MSTANHDPRECPGCKAPFRSMGALGNHARFSKTCTPEMRFWGKVNKTETCWLWLGVPNQKGYGQMTYAGRKNLVVHRFVWMAHFGHIPEGLEVCHKCDVRNCVRPDHLFLGTHQENMDDCRAKGRNYTKLKADDVREIRKLFGRMSGLEIAAKFGVTGSAISDIKCGKKWSHIQ